MLNVHQQLLTRPTYLEIDCDAVRHNFHVVKKLAPHQKILCVIKANAYGHGAVRMAQLFQELGADYLGVAIPEEGVELRMSGITLPILVLSAIADKQIPVCIEHDLTISAPSDEKLDVIDQTARDSGKQAKVHLKVDTGMGRIGVNWSRVKKFTSMMNRCLSIHFEGLYTHFACSDEDNEFNQTQIDRFKQVIECFKDEGFSFDICHMANSGGVLFFPEAHFDMVRAGMMLYGLFEGRELPPGIQLHQAMTWKTEVVYFKFIEKGTGVGYGHKYIAEDDTRIVTLPVGYADGFQRAMGEHGKVIIRDTIYPIAGRICMDQMMVDIGRNGEAYKGDSVILAGSSEHQTISFYDIASWSHTSIYELMCQISARVPRIYING